MWDLIWDNIDKIANVLAIFTFLTGIGSITGVFKKIKNRFKKKKKTSTDTYTTYQQSKGRKISVASVVFGLACISVSLSLFLYTIFLDNKINNSDIVTEYNVSSNEKLLDNDYIIDVDYAEGNSVGCSDICQIGDWIYYVDGQGHLQALSVDGTKFKTIKNFEACSNLTEYKGNLYLFTSEGLCVYDLLNNSSKLLLTKDVFLEYGTGSLPSGNKYCIYNDEIYFLQGVDGENSSFAVYKISIDGSNKTLVYDSYRQSLYPLQSYGEYLYFFEDGRVSYIKMNGKIMNTTAKQIASEIDYNEIGRISDFLVVDDKLFIFSFKSLKEYYLYAFKLNGGNTEELYSCKLDCTVNYLSFNSCFINNKLFFCDSLGLFVYNVAEKKTEKLLDGSWNIVGAAGNWIYYRSFVSPENTYRMRLDGSYTMKLPTAE